VGDGVGEGDGVAFFFGFGGCFWDGRLPDGENDANCGAAPTCTGLTADGAAVFLLPPLALPMPNAAPNATSAATTPIAASLPVVIRTCSLASRTPG
jgi:hypothetical protein